MKKRSFLRDTFRISTAEGIFVQIHVLLSGAGSVFLTKLAVLMGAQPIHFSLMSAITQFSQIFQPLGYFFTRKLASRKKFVFQTAMLNRSLVIFYGILPLIFIPEKAIAVFLILFLISTILGAMAGNAWIAWISDSVPLNIRGRFFSFRSQILMAVGLVVSFIFSYCIDLFSGKRIFFSERIKSLFAADTFNPVNLKFGMAAVFVFAFLSGIIGLIVMLAQPERKKEIENENFAETMKSALSDRNFRKLLVYSMWWMFAVGIGSPYWQPFMIQKLKMTLMEIQLYGVISTVSSVIAIRFWGRFIDKFGNKTAMRFAIILGGLNPLVWLFARENRIWFLFFEAATSGIMWAGAGIVATNFVLAIAPPRRSQIYSGIYGAFSGLGMMATMILSGIFIPKRAIPIAGGILEPEQVLFLITALARWSAQIPLSGVKERGRPFKEAFFFLVEFAKVRVLNFLGSPKRKRSDS